MDARRKRSSAGRLPVSKSRFRLSAGATHRAGSTANAVDSQHTPRRDLVGEVERGPFVRPEPADALTRRRRLTGCQVDEIDVLMAGADIGELDAGWPAQLHRLAWRIDVEHPFTQERRDHAGFFPDFAYGRVVGQFVLFDVPARRKPALEPGVAMEQHRAVVHDEDGYREIAADTVRWLRS